MTALTLRDITKDNWQEAVKLKVAESQKNFVAPNWYSIIEVIFEPDFESRGIYADDTMVGYVMYGIDSEKSELEYWIVRLMMGEAHQNKGYGRKALRIIVKEMKDRYDDCTAVFLSFEPENTIARDFYLSEGFVDIGRVEYGETVFRLDL